MPADPRFTCGDCGREFSVKADVLARYPGWRPARCLPCKKAAQPPPGPGAAARNRPRAAASPVVATARTPELGLTTDQVLERFTAGPHDGVFTDGACSGNPGPGGWGMVWVENDRVLAEQHGYAPHTTNNRMELTALIAAYEALPADAEVTIWSDSNLCVMTLNEWAATWKQRGWKRKTGPVENLDLVRQAYELSRAHPRARLRWIRAHNGSRWNEYADALATFHLKRRP